MFNSPPCLAGNNSAKSLSLVMWTVVLDDEVPVGSGVGLASAGDGERLRMFNILVLALPLVLDGAGHELTVYNSEGATS